MFGRKVTRDEIREMVRSEAALTAVAINKKLNSEIDKIETYVKGWIAAQDNGNAEHKRTYVEHSKQVEGYLAGFNKLLEKLTGGVQ